MSRFGHLLDSLKAYAPLACIEDGAATQTYADLMAECARWQAQLARMGIAPGTVVGLRADYSLAAAAALLALLSRGAVIAMVPRDADPEARLEDACASELLTIDAQGKVHRESWVAVRDHPLLAGLRSRGEGGFIIFTSGSTGRPKAALQSTERFLHKFRRSGRRLRTLAFLLFDHIAGLDTLFYTLASGGTLVLTRRRDPDSILRLIESHRVEVLPASPSFLRLLCLCGPVKGYDLASLKVITYGSEPMDVTTLRLLNERFPNVQISQKYGTTETGSPRSVSRGNDSLWLRIKNDEAGVETKVIDDVLWIRSESTILGYLNAPSPVDEDGWYCTGDLVDVDGEWIRFRGRAAQTINVGGEKVTPDEVEATLLELDFVREAVVEGEPHALMGQVAVARVALNVSMDPEDARRRIRRHCSERLARHKVPVRIELVDDALTSERQKKQRAASGDAE